jgi:RNA polymerase I-specific transcription initiation factor RRN3
VRQFAHIAHKTGFVYCYDIIENNKRSEFGQGILSLPQTPSTSSSAFNLQPLSRGRSSPNSRPSVTLIMDQTMDAELNSFFPFDPYKLPLSHPYVEGVYREWKSVALDDDEEDDEDDEEDDEEDIEVSDGFHGQGMAAGALDTNLGNSFEAMSISPVRSLAITR